MRGDITAGVLGEIRAGTGAWLVLTVAPEQADARARAIGARDRQIVEKEVKRSMAFEARGTEHIVRCALRRKPRA
jgi:hypothetical protein